MTGVLKYLRFSLASKSSNLFESARNVAPRAPRRFQSAAPAKEPPKSSKLKTLLLTTAIGGSAGAVYSYYQRNGLKEAILNSDGEGLPVVWKEAPAHRVSRKVHGPNKSVELILFQYPTCPFCCKVRAFLDYYGFEYNIVEVNPIRKTQMKWSEYKKVPILLIKTDDGYMQLNDSTFIVSVLRTLFFDPANKLKDIVKYYPNIAYMDDDGAVVKEVMNRYHIMYGDIPKGSSKDSIASERKWRRWADNVLVHMLSPNVYRTRAEALESFEWFSEVGEWDKNFSPWEVTSIIQLGSSVMWMLGKRLQKKYNLKPDVRESLYDTCNIWVRLLNTLGTDFHGGARPDLADLAVFGVLNSIEGCSAFKDLRANTKISRWYDDMKRSVGRHDGYLTR